MTEADCGDITLFIEFDDRTYGTKEILMLVLDTPELYGRFCQDLKVFRMLLTKVIGNAKAIHNKCLTASSLVFSTMDELDHAMSVPKGQIVVRWYTVRGCSQILANCLFHDCSVLSVADWPE